MTFESPNEARIALSTIYISIIGELRGAEIEGRKIKIDWYEN